MRQRRGPVPSIHTQSPRKQEPGRQLLLTRVVLQHADIPGATLCEFGEAVLRNVAIFSGFYQYITERAKGVFFHRGGIQEGPEQKKTE